MGDVLVVTLARKDLTTTGPAGHPFEPAFAPNHKFFFQSLENGQAFMNAEFTFVAEELHATMDAILGTPLELMAQHQHYIGEKPQTFHYHFRGRGARRGRRALGDAGGAGHRPPPCPSLLPPTPPRPCPPTASARSSAARRA